MAEAFRAELERVPGPGACQRGIVRNVGAVELAL